MNEGELSFKKRKYSDEFLKYGFTSIVVAEIEKIPKCVICNDVLSAESTKPNKLKRHFDTIHQNFSDKDVQYFKSKADGVKEARLDAEAGTNSNRPTWLLLKLHVWLLSELPKLRSHTQLPRTYCCLQPTI